MSYLTERLIHNTRVQKEVFLSVNDIPINQLGFYGNRSVIVISGEPSGKNDNRDGRSVIRYARNGKAIIFKNPFFLVNFVVGCVGFYAIRAIDYKSVCRRLMPSVSKWDRDSNGLGWRSTWYSAERRTDWTDPGSIGSNQCHVRVVSSKLGYNQRTDDAEGTDQTDNCPYGGDPIKAFGDPKLSRPEFALGGLVIFLAEDFSDNGLEPRRFIPQLVISCMLAVFGGCVCFLAVVPMILHFVWPWM